MAFLSISLFSCPRRSLAALADGQELSTAFWAPRGSALAYVLNNDIYYHQLIGARAVETRRVTFDGELEAVYNGIPDWVYEGQPGYNLLYNACFHVLDDIYLFRILDKQMGV